MRRRTAAARSNTAPDGLDDVLLWRYAVSLSGPVCGGNLGGNHPSGRLRSLASSGRLGGNPALKVKGKVGEEVNLPPIVPHRSAMVPPWFRPSFRPPLHPTHTTSRNSGRQEPPRLWRWRYATPRMSGKVRASSWGQVFSALADRQTKRWHLLRLVKPIAVENMRFSEVLGIRECGGRPSPAAATARRT